MSGHEVREDHPGALQDHPDLKAQEGLHVTQEVLQGPALVSENIELELKASTELVFRKDQLQIPSETLIATTLT